MRAAIRWLLVLVLSMSLCSAGVAIAAKNPPKGWITLNFVNADIGSVIKAMSEMTGRTFVVDPRVKGTLSITSPRPVSPTVAYDIVLSALRMQGYAAIQVNGVVRIVPETDAKFYATAATGKSRRGRAGGEMVTRTFTLKHESSTQLQAALRPLIGASGTLNADADSNTLIVTDYADNLDRLQQVIASLDVSTADEPVLIPLKYASAEEISGLISRVFMPSPGQAPGAAAFDLLQVGVDNRSNSLIVRGRDRNLISKVQNLAASLDVPTPAAGNVHVIYLKNAQAVEVAKTLRNILSADTSALSQTASALSQTAGAQPPTAPSGKSSSSPDLGPGMIQADSASNALIITAPEAVFANLKSVVEKLDVRRAQVLVEALIAEVSADKAAEFGIQWLGATSADSIHNGSKLFGGFGNSSNTSNIGVVASAVAANGAAGAIGIAKGFNLGLFNNQSLGVLARALQTETDANILSTPTLLTLDNEEAKISVGSNVPFLTGQFTVSGTSGVASPFQTIERKDVGLILKVKPQISQGGTVRLLISEEVSKLQQSLDPTLASTDKRSLDSTVLVDDGQIVVLGGLIEDQVQEGEDRLPVLGDIPLLGHLFRYKTRDHIRTNLMIFLRPVIVRNAGDAAAVTNPRYDYILGQQKALAPAHHPILPDAPAPLLTDELKWGTISSHQDNAPTATHVTP
ncbi:MAG TPA: type II secretion system secretin GspD [Thiobacillaceae bacterium]|nr:type II secretion system secretin GspD [Thiobacillaceae bacterium]